MDKENNISHVTAMDPDISVHDKVHLRRLENHQVSSHTPLPPTETCYDEMVLVLAWIVIFFRPLHIKK